MKSELKEKYSTITIDDEFTSHGRVYLQVENDGGGAATSVPLNRLRHLVNTFPPVKATQIEVQLYDAIEYLIMELCADGISDKGEAKAERALARFVKAYGQRRNEKWTEQHD